MFGDKNQFSVITIYTVIFLFYFIVNLISAYNINVDKAIVFTDPFKRPKDKGSYFGYSVALYRDSHYRSPAVLVGAPRANISGLYVYEPGSVFKCSLDGHCSEWLIDRSRNGATKGILGGQSRDSSWLGMTISVEDNDKPRILVCAPRWVILLNRENFMNGMCYYSLANSPDVFERTFEERIKPLTNYTAQTRKIKGTSKTVPHYAMGQLGFSVHSFSGEPTWDVMLGSPGTYTWYGTPILVSENSATVYQTSPTFESRIPQHVNGDAEFNGYSVTSGHYFGSNKRWYASSAPRSDDMKGVVFIFQYDLYSNEISMKNTLTGTQNGEYFGSAMTSCDVDNDNQDDLIVGAPLWSKQGDEGRIYIFSAKQSKFMRLSSWIDGNAVDGRFGSSVTCLGDIDKDDYKDVAVGAPYENGYGVVYIYNGQSEGLSKRWSQRIAGNEFPHSLRGFGISISEPKDIDGNSYNDISIGAHQSGHAVLLRTQPVVLIFMAISDPSRIKLQSNSTSFSIEICSFYNGINVPASLRIVKKLQIDPILGRAYARNLPLNNGSYDWKDVLYLGSRTCNSLPILLVKNITNEIDPVPITASLHLEPTENENSKSPNTFCSTCPVINKRLSKTEDFAKIPFTVDCGSDNICHSNITLNAYTDLGKDNRYVTGTSKFVNLFIDVANFGEAAYQSEIIVTFPDHLSLGDIPDNCFEDPDNNGNMQDVICNLGNPLRGQKNTTLKINMNEVKSDESHVIILVEMFTTSENINRIPPKRTLTIYFDVDVDITVVGKAQESLYSFTNDKEHNKTIEPTRFRHIYEVQKYGVTPIRTSTLKVMIPTQLISNADNKIDIATINQTEISQVSSTARVNSQCIVMEDSDKPKEIIVDDNFGELLDTPYNMSIPNIPPTERTLYLNCSNPSIICTTLFCVFESSDNLTTIAELTITIDLYVQNSDNIMDGKDIVYFVTDGRANITSPEGITQRLDDKPDYFQVGTTFVGSPVAAAVATWIIIVSVLLGLLLLILLTIGLVKLGFFNRKKKQELEALKANQNRQSNIVLETTSSREILTEE